MLDRGGQCDVIDQSRKGHSFLLSPYFFRFKRQVILSLQQVTVSKWAVCSYGRRVSSRMQLVSSARPNVRFNADEYRPCFNISPPVHHLIFPSTLPMLCEICQTINVDELIPPEDVLETGIFSGTKHHASFAELESAAEGGCDLCKAIQACATALIKQPALLRRLSPHPVELKLRLKGHANPGYQGGSKLWASCQGKIIAQLEVYVPRGIDLSLIDNQSDA